MNKQHREKAMIIRFIVLSLVVSSVGVYAADWNITQTMLSTSASQALSQQNVADSRQAINGIRLDQANDSINGADQVAHFDGSSISFTQTGTNADANIQAVNLVSAFSIEGLNQSVSGFANADIVNNAVSANENVQSLNYAQSASNTANLVQFVDGDNVSLASSNLGNIQAVNYAESNIYTGTLEQGVRLDRVTVTNNGGNGVRINSIKGDVSGLTVPAIQNTSINTLIVNGGSTVILNHVGP